MRIYKLVGPSFVFALLLALQLLASMEARAASDLAEGTYRIDYVITKAENESASMANDYFEKPALLTVKGGEITAQVQMNHSKWITQFKTAVGSEFPSAKVLKSDTDEDTRVVQFPVKDLSQPLLSKIHVTVPDIDYDHDYTIRFMFDAKTLKTTGAPAAAAKTAEPRKNNTAGGKAGGAAPDGSSQAAAPVKKTAQSGQQGAAAGGKSVETAKTGQGGATPPVVNPQTGDETPVAMLTGLLLVSGLFILLQLRSKQRRERL
jgi:heme uptake protein IsdC